MKPLSKEETLEQKVKNKVKRWEKGGVSSGKKSLDGDILIDLTPNDEEETCYMSLWESLYSFVDVEISSQKQTILSEIEEWVEVKKERAINMDNEDRGAFGEGFRTGMGALAIDLLSYIKTMKEAK